MNEHNTAAKLRQHCLADITNRNLHGTSAPLTDHVFSCAECGIVFFYDAAIAVNRRRAEPHEVAATENDDVVSVFRPACPFDVRNVNPDPIDITHSDVPMHVIERMKTRTSVP